MTQRDTHEHENVFSYQRLWLANQKAKNNLRDDSPVIGVIMMIAVVALIAAFVAAVAYGVIGGVSEVPCTALVEE